MPCAPPPPLPDPCLRVQSKIAHLPFQFDMQSLVQSQGILQLRSFLGRWYPRLFVLSKYGFLHYFSEDLLVPEATLQLSKCRIESGDEPETFVVTEMNMFVDSRNVIKCATREDLHLWVNAVRPFCCK